jgi:chemotaxis protein MotA
VSTGAGRRGPLDLLTLAGFVFALMAVGVGSLLKGTGLGSLLSGAAFMIVIVGTFAAICIHTPLPVLRHGLKMFGWIVRPPPLDRLAVISRLVEWSQVARRQGLLALEAAIEAERDAFLRKGLQLVVDGTEPEQIRSILEVDLGAREQADHAGARVFESMGVYAPTLGIIGAVLGLMAVMQNLTDPSKLGAGIAAAFTATVYGIGFANLLFLPAAAKLKAIVALQAQAREMMIEGLVSIAQGENPRTIDAKLKGFVQD